MEKELDALAAKVEKVVALVARLQADNQDLRQRLLAAEADNTQLREQMAAARSRLDNLIGQLPEAS
jgi:regulator of replication initiation timing